MNREVAMIVRSSECARASSGVTDNSDKVWHRRWSGRARHSPAPLELRDRAAHIFCPYVMATMEGGEIRRQEVSEGGGVRACRRSKAPLSSGSPIPSPLTPGPEKAIG